MRPLTAETYELFIKMFNGTYKKPVKDRSKEEKNDLILFWRYKGRLSLRKINGQDFLFYDGKKVVTKHQMLKKVTTTYKKTKGAGAISVAHLLKGKYTSISEHAVGEIISKSRSHGEIQAKFTNKPPLKSVRSLQVFQRVQIDLLQLSRINSGERTYRYALTVVDVFSRYLFCRALEKKSAIQVAEALDAIFTEHGWPGIVQCDNGPEFLGPVTRLLQTKGVKIVKERPYHPQSQGRIERQNRTLRSKIRYEEQKHGRSGYNWVVNLGKIVSAINNQPKEVLGYQTPFVVYYARGKSSADKIRKKAAEASERCLKRAYSQHLKKNSCSIYDKGDKIFLRYPFGRRVPYKRYILKGKILARGKGYDMYKIVFKTPQNSILKQWVSVEHITSRTLDEEKRRRENAIKTFERHEQRRHHVQKYYITMDHPTCQQDRTDDSLGSDESGHELDESYFCNNDSSILMIALAQPFSAFFSIFSYIFHISTTFL